jgi:hypothetical protein
MTIAARRTHRLPALLLAGLGLTAAILKPAAGQAEGPVVLAIVAADSLKLPVMHLSTTDASGLTIAGQAFLRVGNLESGDLPALTVSRSDLVRIAMTPSSESVRLTPVREGERQASQTIVAGFQAPSSPGRYHYLVSAHWAAHPDGSRPPSGPAIAGTWALRLIVP